MADRAKLERERTRRVAQAEKRAGIKEGVYVLRGAAHQYVRVLVNFYPREHWIVQDFNPVGGSLIEGTARKLTAEVQARLTSFI